MTFPLETFIKEAKKEKHSEEYIDGCVKYIKKLCSNNFPVIFSIQHLAMSVGMQSDFINNLIQSRDSQYTFSLLQKKDKKSAPREIMAPKEELKYLQRWININILQKAKFNEHIQGFVPGTSTYSNAIIHKGAKYLLKIDLLKFFDCIDEFQVYKIFRSFGYIKNLSWDLAKICTARHRESYWNSFSQHESNILEEHIKKDPAVLPQGAPTSPLLANLAASRMDMRLSNLTSKLNLNYSRYADDLCFSTNNKKDLPFLNILKLIIEDEGFFINEKKIHYCKAGTKQYVTGLTITNEISINKNKRREIFTHLYFARKYGYSSHVKYLEKKGLHRTNYQNWILGHISYQYSINKTIGKKMFDLYNKIDWSIE